MMIYKKGSTKEIACFAAICKMSRCNTTENRRALRSRARKRKNKYKQLFITHLKDYVMREKKINRSKLLQVRLTPDEMQVIANECSHSTCRKLSEYVRKKLMGKPIFVYHRNQSLDDFMTVMIAFKK